MADLQTDVKDVAAKMDKKNKQYRPAIDKLLKANGMDSVDDVIDKAAAEMTAEERKAFEAVRVCFGGGDGWCYKLMPRYVSCIAHQSGQREQDRESYIFISLSSMH